MLEIHSFNLVDYVLCVFILIMVIAGLSRAALRQMLYLTTVVASVSAAGRIYPIISGYFVSLIPELPQPGLWGFILTYTCSHLLVSTLLTIVVHPNSWPVLGCWGELGGGVLGVVTGLIGAAIIAAVFGTFPILSLEELIPHSALAGYLFRRTPVVTLLLPSEFHAVISQVWASAGSIRL